MQILFLSSPIKSLQLSNSPENDLTELLLRLPPELKSRDHQVTILAPFHPALAGTGLPLAKRLEKLSFAIDHRPLEIGIFEAKLPLSDISIYFFDLTELAPDVTRYGFAHAAMEFCATRRLNLDIVHLLGNYGAFFPTLSFPEIVGNPAIVFSDFEFEQQLDWDEKVLRPLGLSQYLFELSDADKGDASQFARKLANITTSLKRDSSIGSAYLPLGIEQLAPSMSQSPSKKNSDSKKKFRLAILNSEEFSKDILSQRQIDEELDFFQIEIVDAEQLAIRELETFSAVWLTANSKNQSNIARHAKKLGVIPIAVQDQAPTELIDYDVTSTTGTGILVEDLSLNSLENLLARLKTILQNSQLTKSIRDNAYRIQPTWAVTAQRAETIYQDLLVAEPQISTSLTPS